MPRWPLQMSAMPGRTPLCLSHGSSSTGICEMMPRSEGQSGCSFLRIVSHPSTRLVVFCLLEGGGGYRFLNVSIQPWPLLPHAVDLQLCHLRNRGSLDRKDVFSSAAHPASLTSLCVTAGEILQILQPLLFPWRVKDYLAPDPRSCRPELI